MSGEVDALHAGVPWPEAAGVLLLVSVHSPEPDGNKGLTWGTTISDVQKLVLPTGISIKCLLQGWEHIGGFFLPCETPPTLQHPPPHKKNKPPGSSDSWEEVAEEQGHRATLQGPGDDASFSAVLLQTHERHSLSQIAACINIYPAP